MAKPAHTATTVLLIRHGATPTTGKILPGRARGLHLSEVGVDQATAVGASLAESQKVTALYASPLERTRETAAQIATACNLEVQRDKGLIECDFGDWTGRRLTDLAKTPAWQTVQRAPSQFRFPGGESFAQMQARIVDTIARLCDRHPGETIAAVSHADPIKAAAASALGTPLDLFQRIMVSPCSVTIITYTSSGPTVVALNASGTHLSATI